MLEGGIALTLCCTARCYRYERKFLLEHLKRKKEDPVARTPLQPAQLYSNLALRHACDDFVER